MKSLFLKELRQGRVLLLFGLVLGLLMPALYVVLVAYARPVSHAEVDEVRSYFAFALLFLPILIALFAGAGLFASEADRGTVPLLFSLPLSRLRIWLSKVLAGLFLTAAASSLLLVVGNLLIPNPQGEPTIIANAYIIDLCLWTLFVYAVAVFASTLTTHSIAATLLSLLLAGGLGALAITVTQLGGFLLGYDQADTVMDTGIWAAVTALPLLLASAVVVSRGELLRSARKFLVGIPTFAIALALVGSLLIGAVRFATRYQRADVETVALFADGQAGVLRSPISLLSYADPTRYVRASDSTGGWQRRSASHDPADGPGPAYRSVYSVLLDPETGRELDVLRLPGDSPWCTPAVSPDGRRVAIAYWPAGLTWGRQQLRHQPQTLRIVDVSRSQVLYQAPLPNLTSNPYAGLRGLRWSPTGSYLAYALPPKVGERASCLHILNADGLDAHIVPGEAADWAWSPTEDILHILSRDMTVKRFRPEGTSNETIWTPDPSDLYTRRTLSYSGISPDGRWLVLREEQIATVETHTGSAISLKRFGLRAISTDGQHAQVIWSAASPRRSTARLAWSSEGAALYFAVWPDHPGRAQLLRWAPGEAEPSTIIAELPYNSVSLFAVPHSDEILVWAQLRGQWSEHSEVYEAEVFTIDISGGKKSLAIQADGPAFARGNIPRGLDPQGRLIYQPADLSTLNALDLHTGQVTTIYP